jgi:hypothetical protein
MLQEKEREEMMLGNARRVTYLKEGTKF